MSQCSEATPFARHVNHHSCLSLDCSHLGGRQLCFVIHFNSDHLIFQLAAISRIDDAVPAVQRQSVRHVSAAFTHAKRPDKLLLCLLICSTGHACQEG